MVQEKKSCNKNKGTTHYRINKICVLKMPNSINFLILFINNGSRLCLSLFSGFIPVTHYVWYYCQLHFLIFTTLKMSDWFTRNIDSGKNIFCLHWVFQLKIFYRVPGYNRSFWIFATGMGKNVSLLSAEGTSFSSNYAGLVFLFRFFLIVWCSK